MSHQDEDKPIYNIRFYSEELKESRKKPDNVLSWKKTDLCSYLRGIFDGRGIVYFNDSNENVLSIQLNELEGKMEVVQEKAKIIEKIDSRIDVANVLAEMSFLIDEKIVLSNVEFIAEKFQDKQQGQQSTDGAVVRAVRTSLNDKQKMPFGDVRFKIVINGVAVDASDVAALICKLEDSPYFCQVVLSYSKNTEITAKDDTSVRSKAELKSSNVNARKNEGNKKSQLVA